MDFDLLDYPLAWTMPELLSETSAWIGHIPFALALLEMLEPGLFVELGTHRGDSYCAICQGIQQKRLPTRSVAIDTWQGDPHAGEYGPEILDRLRAHHDPRFASFSSLLQSDFTAAAAAFEDLSVDLLHIDGLHTYEAVRHDYHTWRSKMSDRGVILFHDVAVKKQDFGVWKFWQEIESQFPSFSFEHSGGLGVLAVGANPPARVAGFLKAARDNPQRVRDYFAALGNRIELLRMARLYLGAMDYQRQEIDRWRTSHSLPARGGPMPSSAKFSAIRHLMDDFNDLLGRTI